MKEAKEKEKNEEVFTTDDLWLATYLLMREGKLVNCKSNEDGRIFFQIKGTNLEENRADYVNGGRISVISYRKRFYSLRYKMHSEMEKTQGQQALK